MNYKVVWNFSNKMITKLQPHWLSEIKMATKTLQLGLLKNSKRRELKIEFFGLVPVRI
ncbi:hypothetical protein KFY46_25595 [Salmonella enterica subsp. enterica serovar 1,4,[5],12:i:-]|nr:hypothetical protein [Salmonella enterica subsp. enterica serovar 1,4,[5],12:i:-]